MFFLMQYDFYKMLFILFLITDMNHFLCVGYNYLFNIPLNLIMRFYRTNNTKLLMKNHRFKLI